MNRCLILAVMIVALGSSVVSAESFRAFLIWVDVPGKKVVLIMYPTATKEKGGDRVKALREGKEFTLAVDEKVKVFTRTGKTPKDVAENPRGLNGIKMFSRIDPKFANTIPMIDVVVNDDSKKITTIKELGNLAIVKKKDRPSTSTRRLEDSPAGLACD